MSGPFCRHTVRITRCLKPRLVSARHHVADFNGGVHKGKPAALQQNPGTEPEVKRFPTQSHSCGAVFDLPLTLYYTRSADSSSPPPREEETQEVKRKLPETQLLCWWRWLQVQLDLKKQMWRLSLSALVEGIWTWFWFSSKSLLQF